MKVIIIGAGPSGLTSAIYAAKNNHDVEIIEKNNNVGKKLLITGSGKCNYFNSDFNIKHYRSSNIDILSKIITEENKNKVLSFFDSIGIVPKIKNGYYYPSSNQAVSMQNSLLKEALNLNVKINYNEEILNVTYNNKFEIKTNVKTYICDKVVLATGSKAAPKTGSDGMGYKIAKNFNHSIVKVLPALVQLKGNETYFKLWKNIRSDVKIKLYENDKFIKEEAGEIMLTDYGISGICTLQLSSIVARGLYLNKKEEVEINFMPMIDTDNLIEYINKRNDKLKNRNIVELFEGIVNYKLLYALYKIINIDSNLKWNELNKKQKEEICKVLKEFRLKITDTNSFNEAQVCSGGIPLDEINLNMESNIQKNLYIVGELLDVDGDCGGYNLAFAFISGMLAGENND